MLVLGMNSKRQRRPNVRLGEVGDVPAAFACEYTPKNKDVLGLNSCENDLLINNDTNQLQDHLYGFPLETISPIISADLQHNIENNNPNSSNSALNDTDMAKGKLNFGTITRKCRVMKRRTRNTNGANDAFSNAWSSGISIEDRKDNNFNDFVRFSSDEWNDYIPNNSNKDSVARETSATSKEDCTQKGNYNELWHEDVCDEGNNMSPESDDVHGAMNFGGSDVNLVSRWLGEKGFGKYAGMFKMHEVDEEALPMLTLEDLKEIGVFAVGSRRKLYTAIQQLRTNISSENTSV